MDVFLADRYPEHSRNVFQRLIRAQRVLVNGKPVRASQKVDLGDKIKLELPLLEKHELVGEDLPLEIVYEDQWIVLINKQPGLVVHPARGHWRGTVANALVYRYEELRKDRGELRPGIVHRLDRDTSGLLMVAKEAYAHRHLSRQLERRRVEKQYAALCWGEVNRDSDYIEIPLGPHPTAPTRRAPAPPGKGQRAVTFYQVVERFDGFSLVHAFPKTGRTHQIRVHLATIGHPIVADKEYGGRNALRMSNLRELGPEEEDVCLLNRHALHAHRLRFMHPRLQEFVEFEAPLPADIQASVDALRTYRPPKKPGG